jgi:hypothetical protein
VLGEGRWVANALDDGGLRLRYSRLLQAVLDASDLQIPILIEERENTNAVLAEKLSDAMLSMLKARMICNEGRVMDAMVLYDSIAKSIDLVPSALTGHCVC